MYTQAYFNRLFWVLFGLAGLLLFIRLGAAPIYILDEAKNAQCAREMYLAGNWVVPTFNGELRTDKPALHYWFMMISYSAFGVGEWQARLFSALAGWSTIFTCFWFVKRYVHATAAFFAALALVLSTHFLFEFRLAVPDPYLIVFTALGLFAGFAYLQERSFKWLSVAAVSLALATLAKGPVALGLPGISLLLFIFLKRQWWVFTDWRLLVAALLYGAVAIPWYLAVHQATGGAFTQGFFLEHNLNRFSSEMEGHGGPFILTLLIVLVGLLPFSVYVYASIRRLWQPKLPAMVLLAGIVALVYIVFFSVSSTKLPNYPMPCYPFAAVVLGFYVSEMLILRRPLPVYGWWILLVLGAAIPVAGYFGLKAESVLESKKWFAAGLGVLPVCLLAAKRFWRSNQLKAIGIMAIGYSIFNVYFVAVAYPIVYNENPVKSSLDVIGQDTAAIVVSYKEFNAAYNFNLPAQKLPIRTFGDTLTLAGFCRTQTAVGGKPILVISRTDKLTELNPDQFEEVFRRRDLFELPTTILLRYKKF